MGVMVPAFQVGGRPQPQNRLTLASRSLCSASCLDPALPGTAALRGSPCCLVPIVRVSGPVCSRCCSPACPLSPRSGLLRNLQGCPGLCLSAWSWWWFFSRSAMSDNPMDCSTPSLSVPHHLPEVAQVHVHCVSDAVSSSDALFFCPQSFPASGTFPVSQLFTSGGQNTGVSTSASVLPMSIQG